MIEFKVVGIPVPEGSTRGFVYNGRAKIVHQNSAKLKQWRMDVENGYRESGGNYNHDSPIEISIRFHFTRPKSVSPRKRPYHTVKPDLDKLCRGVLDGLTGVAFDDDSQVMSITASKQYSDWNGAIITVGIHNEGQDNVADKGLQMQAGSVRINHSQVSSINGRHRENAHNRHDGRCNETVHHREHRGPSVRVH